jgi:hypothetical protein
LHTAIISRRGSLTANVEANQFTADQLSDLVQTVLSQESDGTAKTPTRLAGKQKPKPFPSR